jgi:4-amino-4-deoxychorismate lyase
MEVAGMLGIPVRIAEFSLARLLEAEEVFLCNSVAGIWRVRELSGRTWRPGYVTAAIRQALENDSNV